MRGGNAGLGKERKKERTSKRASINPTPTPGTQKLAIDLRSLITANSPPNPPSHLQTTTDRTNQNVNWWHWFYFRCRVQWPYWFQQHWTLHQGLTSRQCRVEQCVWSKANQLVLGPCNRSGTEAHGSPGKHGYSSLQRSWCYLVYQSISKPLI